MPSIYIHKTITDLHKSIARIFTDLSRQAQQNRSYASIALPGGGTPVALFQYLAEENVNDKIDWKYVHLFWGDERCVPPQHEQSNFGMAYANLISRIHIPAKNIHRIRGEEDPGQESFRYEREIITNVREFFDSVPCLDWILLGLGADGHTASLFKDQVLYGLCAPATNPDTGQNRISMTYQLINHAKRVSFMVTGTEKAKIVATILKPLSEAMDLPAAKIKPVSGILEWFLDDSASSML